MQEQMEGNENLERTGTELSGFVSSGPQFCGRCVHNQNSICMHPIVALDPDLASRVANGGVQINPETDCCEYVNVGEGTDEESEPDENAPPSFLQGLGDQE